MGSAGISLEQTVPVLQRAVGLICARIHMLTGVCRDQLIPDFTFLCFAERCGPECGVEMCANQGVCRDLPRTDLTCPCVAESGGPECGVETCANQGVCRDLPRPDLTFPCFAESSRPQYEEETCYT